MLWGIWLPEMSNVHPPSMIIVGIETTKWEVFQAFIQRLKTNGRLAQTIVDKAKLVLMHKSFRPVMATLKWLGSVGVQIVLPTATMPPSLKQDFLDAFGITTCFISRAKMLRHNISFNVVHSTGVDLDGMVHEEYKKATTYSTGNQVLIFCHSKADARHMAEMLKIPCCNGEMSQDEIDSLLK
jgi:superfamily II DNA helicase RecQ